MKRMRALCGGLMMAGGLTLGCSLPGRGGPPSEQVLSDALQGLLSARSFPFAGSLTVGLPYGVDLVAAGRNLDGTIGDGRVSVAVRRVGNSVFERGAQYFHLNGQPLVSDDYWVLHHAGDVSKLVARLSDWRSLV